MCVRRRALIAIVVSLVLCHAGRALSGDADFPVPASLRVAVNFWKNVFGRYSEHQILIHDTEHLGRVYSVLDYRDLASGGEGPIALELTERAGMASEKERMISSLPIP